MYQHTTATEYFALSWVYKCISIQNPISILFLNLLLSAGLGVHENKKTKTNKHTKRQKQKQNKNNLITGHSDILDIFIKSSLWAFLI